MKTLVLGFLLMVLPSLAVASSTVPTDRTITKIWFFKMNIVIEIEPTYSNSEGCTHADADERAALLVGDDPNMNLRTAVLAAYMSGHKVGMSLSGCVSAWGETIPKVEHIEVAPSGP